VTPTKRRDTKAITAARALALHSTAPGATLSPCGGTYKSVYSMHSDHDVVRVWCICVRVYTKVLDRELVEL